VNPLKEKLKRGEWVCGQMILEFFTPGVASILANAGAEFVLFDMEHCRCDISLVAEMIAFCGGTSIVPIVRVPDAGVVPLSRVCDLGARGVMVPRIESRVQMEQIVSKLKYAPSGCRGVALGIAHDRYCASGSSYFAEANDDIVVIALLETAKAFDNLEEIVSVPGVDVAWMGHYDLTVSLGIPAQFDHPKFLAQMDALVETCARHRVAPGFLPATPEDAIHWIKKGFRMISFGTDIALFTGAFHGFRQTVNEALRAPSPKPLSKFQDASD
jgi:2-keto-3-deoxy-L-rhamnonate aldolase RhmA